MEGFAEAQAAVEDAIGQWQSKMTEAYWEGYPDEYSPEYWASKARDMAVEAIQKAGGTWYDANAITMTSNWQNCLKK